MSETESTLARTSFGDKPGSEDGRDEAIGEGMSELEPWDDTSWSSETLGLEFLQLKQGQRSPVNLIQPA